jgi:hypothetical protein
LGTALGVCAITALVSLSIFNSAPQHGHGTSNWGADLAMRESYRMPRKRTTTLPDGQFLELSELGRGNRAKYVTDGADGNLMFLIVIFIAIFFANATTTLSPSCLAVSVERKELNHGKSS